MRVCEVTSNQLRWEAGEVLRKEVLTHKNLPPSVFRYILNASKSNWASRFPWSRIVLLDERALPLRKRHLQCVIGVILCESCESDKTMEVRFVAGCDEAVEALLNNAEQHCKARGYTSMYLWCGEWFEREASLFVQFGFVPRRRQRIQEGICVLYSKSLMSESDV
jgi:hypothetical protein